MERTVEQSVDVLVVADMMVDILVLLVAVVQKEEKLVPQERVQQRTADHAPVPRLLEETVEVVRLVPRESVQQRSTTDKVRQKLSSTPPRRPPSAALPRRSTDLLGLTLKHRSKTDSNATSTQSQRMRYRSSEYVGSW